ncbi:CLIP-associating protein, partial [Papilio machaon]
LADHQNSAVRKAAVFCMVAFTFALGEERMQPHLKHLSVSKFRLLQVTYTTPPPWFSPGEGTIRCTLVNNARTRRAAVPARSDGSERVLRVAPRRLTRSTRTPHTHLTRTSHVPHTCEVRTPNKRVYAQLPRVRTRTSYVCVRVRCTCIYVRS